MPRNVLLALDNGAACVVLLTAGQMTCAGGAIAFESLIMYGLWCAYKCTPTDLKGGWYGAA
jgi:hypothetical protein